MSEQIAIFMKQVVAPCKDAKDKYKQLKKFMQKREMLDFMPKTIKHALSQSSLVGGWSGFDLNFWIQVQSEYLKDNESL